jgi:hypothetical protein
VVIIFGVGSDSDVFVFLESLVSSDGVGGGVGGGGRGGGGGEDVHTCFWSVELVAGAGRA